jgi:hypothetical protein
MTTHCLRLRFAAAWILLACVLLTTFDVGVVLAYDSADSQASTIRRDIEMPPLMQTGPARPRYAGWLLGAYLVPPVVAIAGIAADSSVALISSAALLWLAPTAVHLFAGQYGLAARAALVVIGFAAAGVLVGGAVGLGIAEVIGHNQTSGDERLGLHHVLGFVAGGLLGGSVGVLTWAIIDVSQAFARDSSRRDYGRFGVQKLALSVVPGANGASAVVAAMF